MKRIARIVVLVLLPLVVASALAQYPTRPIRLVIAFPGGGGPANMTGRLAQMMGPALGQNIVLDNRPGADGAIAVDIVLKANPDGYTLLSGSNSTMSALPHLRKTPSFDPVAAFAPVGMFGPFTFFLLAHSGVPAKTVAELIEYARANPGKLSYGSGNSAGIVMMAQFTGAKRLDMVHVPYKGDVAALNDFVAGRVQLMFGSTAFLPMVKDGRLRALAVALPRRTALLPEVPTLDEAGAGQVDVQVWGGLFAPAKTPKDIVMRLNRELNAVLRRPEAQELAAREGIQAQPSTPEELGEHVKRQLDIWGRAMRSAGINPE